jgi:hypothetical protein
MNFERQKSNKTNTKAPIRRNLLSRRVLLRAGLATTLLTILPLCAELRIEDPNQPLTDNWTRIPIVSRGSALLGISFRPLQAQAYGLEIRQTLSKLLEYPIQMVRLGAYWNRIEPNEGVFETSELDWQIDAVERAGAKIILCVGALKTFGFPEYFIPQHYMPKPFADGTLITSTTQPGLLDAAKNFVSMIVSRYKERESIVAWQLENEPADPLTFAHYWRVSTEFVKQELGALRACDPIKPVMINGGFIPSLSIRIAKAWQTRDQGDSLALAKAMGDIIGVDYYPRFAISSIASKNIYIDSTGVPWEQGNRDSLAQWAQSHEKKFMVTESQSEPWELTIIPPNPPHHALYSCTPQNLIENYNTWANCAKCQPLYSYLFWGAEYWVLRWKSGDQQYLRAFARILERA